MSALRRALAILFAALFAGSTLVAFVFFNFDRRAFSADTYEKVFATQGFYDRIPTVLAQSIASTPLQQDKLPAVMRGLDAQAWESFFRALLPSDALKAMGDQALESTFAYLDLQSDTATISMAPLKTSMSGDDGVRAIYSLLSKQPDCSLEQAAKITLNLLSAKDIQFCNPPDSLHEILTPLIHAQMQVTAAVIPDEVVLASAVGVPAKLDARVRLQKARLVMRLTPLLPLAFLLLLSMTAVNSLQSFLDWWGIPFLISGVLAMLVGLSGARLLGSLLKHSITQRAPNLLPAALADYAKELANAMINTLARPILIDGFVLAALGLVLVIAAYIVRSREKSLPPSEQKTIVE